VLVQFAQLLQRTGESLALTRPGILEAESTEMSCGPQLDGIEKEEAEWLPTAPKSATRPRRKLERPHDKGSLIQLRHGRQILTCKLIRLQHGKTVLVVVGKHRCLLQRKLPLSHKPLHYLFC
jgi:hypothetical protein